MLACVQRELPGIFTTKVLTGVCNQKNNRLLEILPKHEEFFHRGGGPPAPGSVLRARRAAAHSSPRSNPRDADGVIKARLIHVDSHALIPLVYFLIFAILPTEGYSQTPPIQNVMTSHVLTGCDSFIPLIVASRGLSYLLRDGLWGPVNCNQESTVTGALGVFSRWRQPRGSYHP